MLDVITLILGLLIGVAVLAVLAKKLQIPEAILMVLGGALFGLIPGLPHVRLNPNLVFLIFLPPLLYPAALFTSWRDFHANLRPISILAIGLVLFTTSVIAWLAHHFMGLPLAAGYALGAIISPPDAVAAKAITERLRVPRRIVTILDGESLVNDATALVAYRFAVAAIATGTFSLAQAGMQFFLVGIGGILVGLVVGVVASWIQKHLDHPPVQITISLLTPFAAYLPAERWLGVSGVLAVVTTGLYMGWRAPQIINSRMRLQAGPVWEMIEFLLNGLIFILIGLQLPEVMHALTIYSAGQLWWYATLISVAVIVIRLLWVFPAIRLPRLLFNRIHPNDPDPSWQQVALIGWTGMRGVVSLAAALALPIAIETGPAFPGRALIIFLTFTVIVVTLVVQGLSLPLIIRWLGIEDDRTAEQEEREARLKANQAALARLNELAQSQPISADTVQRLRIEYEDRIRQLEVNEEESHAPRRLFSSDYEQLSYETLLVERRTILQLRNERTINDQVLRRIQRDIDLAEARLQRPP